MLYSGKSSQVSSGAAVTSVRSLSIIFVVGLGLSLQACSASREQGDGSSWKLWGSDKPQESAAARQPSAFDKDGPPSKSSDPVYRGGRDPVSGRANDWPPAAQPPAESTAMAPMPQYSQQPPAAYPAPSYTPPPYPQQPYAQPQTAPYPVAPYPVAPYPVARAASRPQGAAPAPVTMPAPGNVEVRPGDTLYRIAKAHHVTVPALMQANGLANESIRPGQRLTIPAN